MYNNLSNKENLKRLKLLLQMKKEIRKLEIKSIKNKDSSLKNKELTKKLQIKKDNYERLTGKKLC